MIRIIKDSLSTREEIFSVTAERVDISAVVREVIDNVRQNGDEALKFYTEKFDKVKLDSLRVSEAEINEAVASVEPEFIRILKDAAKNIYEYYRSIGKES